MGSGIEMTSTYQTGIQMHPIFKFRTSKSLIIIWFQGLLKKISAFFQQSLDKNKKNLKQYLSLEREYVQFLDKIANLEMDLKYQQDYFKQH